MFPSFNTIVDANEEVQKDDVTVKSLCPLGCLCCIMQQFYNRRCWCKEVKESRGTQTDPSSFDDTLQPVPTKVTVDIAIQTDHLETQDTAKHENESKAVEDVLSSQKKSIDIIQQSVSIMKRRLYKQRAATSIFKDDNSDSSNLSTDLKMSADQSKFTTILENALVHTNKDTATNDEMRNYTLQGTIEHGKLQCAVNDIMDRYDLTGAKDPKFEDAFNEVLDKFPVLRKSVQCKHMVRSKLRHRISSKRHYTRIRSEANAIGIAVSALKRKKVEENAIQHKLLGESIVRNSIGGDQKQTFPLLKVPSDQTPVSSISMTSHPEFSKVTSYPVSFKSMTVLPIKLTTAATFDDHRTLINGKNDFTEEALDLSDPRNDVIIKIEPPDLT